MSSSDKQQTYVGEDLYAQGGGSSQGEGSPRPGGGLFQSVDRGPAKIGRNRNEIDSRKFPFDRLGALVKGPVEWHVTRDDRMSPEEAGEAMGAVFRMWGVERQNVEILSALADAIFFGHTLNSGSVLQPGRSVIRVAGATFHFYDVVNHLQADNRRFFRAYADEIRAVNRRILNDCDYSDPDAVLRREWLLEVAADRGLMRYPELAHDSSEKCSMLRPAERVAIANSKVGVFASIVNSADRLTSNSRIMTADKYDSTNKKTIADYAATSE